MRNPTPEELIDIVPLIDEHEEAANKLALLEARLRHDLYRLKKVCGVPRSPDVVLDHESGTWARVGMGKDGPTRTPLETA